MRLCVWKGVFLGFLTALAIGCAPGPRRVFVDVDSVLRSEPIVEVREAPLPKPPPGDPGATFIVSGRPEKTIRDQGGRVDTSVEQIEAAQHEAIRQLDLRLRAFYSQEVERFRNRRSTETDKVKASAYDAALKDLMKVFTTYAYQRGPKVAALAVIVGWPDPGPRATNAQPANGPSGSAASPRPLRPSAEYNRSHSIALRKEIADLDASFDKQSQLILAKAQGIADADAAKALLELDKFRDDVNARADAEAAAQVRSTPKQLDIRLADARAITLPAVPDKVLHLAPQPSPQGAPKVPLSEVGNDESTRRKMIEQELQIWLGLHRYVAAPHNQAERDATAEFKAWRKTLLSAGP